MDSLAATTERLVTAMQSGQETAQQLGSALKSAEVLAWAMKHAVDIPNAALKELMDIIKENK